MKIWQPLILFFLGTAMVSATFESVEWTKAGTTKDLNCSSEYELTVCSWSSPTTKQFQTKKFENEERLSIIKSEKNCVLRIENVQNDNEGLYQCKIGYQNEKEFAIYDHNMTLGVAKYSDKIQIRLSEKEENDTKTTYTCSIAESNPLPNFSWLIDEEEFKDQSMEVNTTEDGLSQILTYEHHSKLNNKTLKCKVDFAEHGIEAIFEEAVKLQVTNNTQKIPEPMETLDGPTITILAVICVVVFICLVVLCLYQMGILRNPPKSDDDTDAETGTSDSLPMKESIETEKSDDNETEKADSTKDENEKLTVPANATIKDRLASFFRINKSFNMDDENIDEAEKKTNECEEVVVDNAGDKKEEKPECNGHDRTDETVDVDSKKAIGGNKFFAFFAKVFKPRADVVADKNATEEPTVVVDNDGQKTEETKSLIDELEPEDKPEPIAEEVKQEDKPEPITDEVKQEDIPEPIADEVKHEDKPELVDEKDDKKEPTPNASF